MKYVNDQVVVIIWGQEDGEVRVAIWFAVLAAVVGVGFLIAAALWVALAGERVSTRCPVTRLNGRC